MKPIVCFVILSLFVSLLFPVKEAAASDAIETAGNIGRIALPATAALLTLLRNDREGSLQFIETFTTTTATTLALKYAVKESRPNNGGDHSFPSFHAASAFAGAGFIQQRYGWKEGALAYAAAAFVGYSRIESRKHYFRDVLGGAAIGILSSLVFTTPFVPKELSVTPVARQDFTGLVISKRF